jgi:hypothetical protein
MANCFTSEYRGLPGQRTARVSALAVEPSNAISVRGMRNLVVVQRASNFWAIYNNAYRTSQKYCNGDFDRGSLQIEPPRNMSNIIHSCGQTYREVKPRFLAKGLIRVSSQPDIEDRRKAAFDFMRGFAMSGCDFADRLLLATPLT